MPKYVVEGADRRTGEDRKLSVDAPDQELARAEAQRQGIMVSLVRLTEEDDDLNAMASEMSSKLYRVTQPAPTVSYRSPGTAQGALPEYFGLLMVGWSLRVLGVGQLLFGVISFLIEVFSIGRSGGGIMSIIASDYLSGTIQRTFWGVIWFGMGEGAFVARDIARSYLRNRDQQEK